MNGRIIPICIFLSILYCVGINLLNNELYLSVHFIVSLAPLNCVIPSSPYPFNVCFIECLTFLKCSVVYNVSFLHNDWRYALVQIAGPFWRIYVIL